MVDPNALPKVSIVAIKVHNSSPNTEYGLRHHVCSYLNHPHKRKSCCFTFHKKTAESWSDIHDHSISRHCQESKSRWDRVCIAEPYFRSGGPVVGCAFSNIGIISLFTTLPLLIFVEKNLSLWMCTLAGLFSGCAFLRDFILNATICETLETSCSLRTTAQFVVFTISTATD